MFEQLNKSFQHVFGEYSAAAGYSTNVADKSEGPLVRSDMPSSVEGVYGIDYDKLCVDEPRSFEGVGEHLEGVRASEQTADFESEEEEEEEEEELDDDEEQDFGDDDDPDDDWMDDDDDDYDDDDYDDDDDDDWLDEEDEEDEEYWDDEDEEDPY